MTTIFDDLRVRFLIAGGSAALLNWLVRFPLNHVLQFGGAVVAAQAVGMTYGFIIYRYWALPRATHRAVFSELRDFVLVNFAGAMVCIGGALAVEVALILLLPSAFAAAVAHAAGIAGGAVVNFVGHKHVTFRQRGPSR